MSRGRFVVVEGGEGVGKSTQVRRLRAFLEAGGLPVVVTREPGGTAVGEGIREVLLHGRAGSVAPEAELLLILAARAALVREVVEPALAAGKWVLSDRFDLSSLAYQGYARGIPADLVARLNEFATGGLAPDLCIVLDLPVEEGMARQALAGKSRDRFESQGRAFLGRVRRGYVELARSRAGTVLLSARGSPGDVEARIRREVALAFPEAPGAAGPASRREDPPRPSGTGERRGVGGRTRRRALSRRPDEQG